VWFGPSSLERLPELLAGTGAGRVLLVTDPGLSATSWPDQAETLIRSAGPVVVPFTDVESNPRHETVNRMADAAKAAGVDLVVGLGGGSVLDAAKAAAMLLTNPGGCEAYEGPNRFSARPAPFIAIPTSCGTGSEVTWVSVITREDQKRKISVKGDGMFPDHALVDPDTLRTLPPQLVAWTGADALTHAIEACVCTEANPASDALAEAACRLIFGHLGRAVTDIEGDAEARKAMMYASTIAGMAFGNADVASVHCLSESIGGLTDAPHGLTNAVLLVPVLEYQLGAARARLARLHRTTGGDDTDDDTRDAQAFLTRVRDLLSGLGIPGIETLDLKQDDLQRVAEMAAANGSNASSPMPMAASDYVSILEMASGE
jgi:alcohol dehydrogenase